MKLNFNVKENMTALMGMLTALAMIFSYVEAMIPINFGIPGVKLGLPNLIIVIIIYRLDIKSAFTVSFIRIILTGFLFGNLFSIIYGLAGAVSSIVSMTLAKKSGKFSICGVSMLGGVMHNVGQLFVAAFAVGSFSIMYYAPALLISGLIMGLIIGVAAMEMLKRI